MYYDYITKISKGIQKFIYSGIRIQKCKCNHQKYFQKCTLIVAIHPLYWITLYIVFFVTVRADQLFSVLSTPIFYNRTAINGSISPNFYPETIGAENQCEHVKTTIQEHNVCSEPIEPDGSSYADQYFPDLLRFSLPQ